MRKLLLFLLIGLTLPAAAQFTTVTGTVVDPNGIPYAGGTISPILVIPSGAGSPTLNGAGYTPPSQPTGLDNNGSFTLRLADNAVLLPASTKWNFMVCSAKGTVNPAIGTGSQCFTLASAITITGASQSITTNLHAAALALTVPIGSGVTSVTGVSPITSTGGTTPAIGCPTCETITVGGIPVSTTNAVDLQSADFSVLITNPSNGAVDFSVQGVPWNGFTNPLGGGIIAMGAFNTNWQWTTSNGQFAENNITSATSSVAQSSPKYIWSGAYWNGSSSVGDSWTVQDVIANGTNGASTYTFTHSGSPGTASVSFPIANVTTGYRVGGGATSGHVLRGNGTNFVDAAVSFTDLTAAGTVRLVNQVAAIGTTTIFTTGANTAQYLIAASVYCDSASAGATVTLTITYTDPSNTSQTITPSAATCTTLGASSFAQISSTVAAKNATNVTYSTSIANTPTYDLRIVVTQMTTN
jgi:hypothetical protein